MFIIPLALMVNMLSWTKLVNLIFRLRLNLMVDTPICILCCIGLVSVITLLFLPARLFSVTLVAFLLTLLMLLIWCTLRKDVSENCLLKNVLNLIMTIVLGLLVSFLALALALVPIVLVLKLLTP